MKNNLFRCFGISKSDVMSLLSPLLSDNHGVLVEFKEDRGLLVDISLKSAENNTYFYEFTREIFEKLNQFIYSENEMSLQQTAFELLKIIYKVSHHIKHIRSMHHLFPLGEHHKTL